MGRVINTNSPGKRRSFYMRTLAEILRRLSQKTEVDADTKDMLAMTIYCLAEIDETVIESCVAWEKRDYWKKANEFQQKWGWTKVMRKRIEEILQEQQWSRVPVVMAALFPYLSDIVVKQMMRNPDSWLGAYDRYVAGVAETRDESL